MEEILKALEGVWPYKRVEAPDWLCKELKVSQMFLTVGKDVVTDDDFWIDMMVSIPKMVEEAEPITLD